VSLYVSSLALLLATVRQRMAEEKAKVVGPVVTREAGEDRT
jgi:hypothetical protein